MQDARI